MKRKPGFTRVPNSLIEAISQNRAFCEKTRVLCAILRKTAGWNKCSDLLSNTQIAELTGMQNTNVSRAVRRLVDEKIISTSGKKFRMKVISLDMLNDQFGYADLSKSIPTKDTQAKDIFQKTQERDQKIIKWFREHDINNPHAYLLKIKRTCQNEEAIEHAWRDAHRAGVESPSLFFKRCEYYAAKSKPP